MGLLDKKVAIITGAGGGLGEAYAKLFAREGAAVVVNDLGGPRDGSGSDKSMAQKGVDAIKANGGRAVANGAGISTLAARAPTSRWRRRSWMQSRPMAVVRWPTVPTSRPLRAGNPCSTTQWSRCRH